MGPSAPPPNGGRSTINAFWPSGGRRAYWRFCVEASCSSLSDPSTRSKAPRSITSTVVSTVAVTVAARLSAESSASSPAKAEREAGVQLTHGTLAGRQRRWLLQLAGWVGRGRAGGGAGGAGGAGRAAGRRWGRREGAHRKITRDQAARDLSRAWGLGAFDLARPG